MTMKQLAYGARSAAVVLIWAVSLAQQAWALGDPVNGQSLYGDGVNGTGGVTGSQGNSCAICHGDPATNSQNVLKGMRTPSAISNAIANNIGQMGELSGKFSASDLEDIAAYISAIPVGSPANLSYAAASGHTDTRSITVTNTGGVNYKITGASLSGANLSSFAITSNTCLNVVLGGALTATTGATQCTIGVTYTSSGGSSETASLDITGTPTKSNGAALRATVASVSIGLSVPLAGNTTSLSLSPNQVTLPYVAASGATPASWTPATSTLTNDSGAVATITSVTAGSAHVTLTSGASYCRASQVLQVGDTCLIEVNADAAASTTVEIVTDMGNQSLSVVAAAPPSANNSNAPSGASTSPKNAGSGGCTIAGMQSEFDPMWLLMVLGATGVSAWRHRPGRRQSHESESGR
jgi:cytochrome c553